MKSIVLIAIVVVVGLLSTAEARRNFFQYPCPIGCAQSVCGSIGCTRCTSSFSLHFQSGMGACVQTCRDGFYSERTFLGSVCTRCNIRNCRTCSSRTVCTRCRSSLYALQTDGSCTRSFRG